MTVHVLLSARDPGGAAQVREVAPALRADARARVTVAASSVAAEILSAAGETPVPFALPDGATHVARDADPSALLAVARDLMERVAPDALLVGISSLGVGLDEALLACAAGRPTFGLQDYPGDANAVGGAYAGVYFVRDEAAAALTQARFGVSALPVGSLRHASYRHLDVAALRARTREHIGARPEHPVIGFFGQPAAIPGHEAAFRDLTRALAGRRDRPLVILREHPKAKDLREEHTRALIDAGATVLDASDVGAVEPWLAACDLVTTCFSHCTMDYAFLDAHSSEPLGAVLFLLTTPESRGFMREYAGIAVPDGVELGLGRIAETPAQVGALIDALLTPEGRREYHAATARLPRRAAVDLIVETVIGAGLARVAPGRSLRPSRAGR